MYRWYVIAVIILLVAVSGCKNEELDSANQRIGELNKIVFTLEGKITQGNNDLKHQKQAYETLMVEKERQRYRADSFQVELIKFRDREKFAWVSYGRVRDDFVLSLTRNSTTIKYLRRKQVMIGQELLVSTQAFNELMQDYVSITIWQNSVIPWYKYYRDMNDRSGASKFLGLGKAKKPGVPEPII